MLDFNQIETHDEVSVNTLLKGYEQGIITKIQKLFDAVGFKFSDLFCTNRSLDVLNGTMGRGDDNVYYIVPYYVFLRIFTTYGDHLLAFYSFEDLLPGVYESFKKYIDKLKDDLSYYDDTTCYDLSNYPGIESYEEILKKTQQATGEYYEENQGSQSCSRTFRSITWPAEDRLRSYPFNLIYPVLTNDSYFYLYHNTTRLAICSSSLQDISLFNENDNSKDFVPFSGVAYTTYISKFYNLLTSQKNFVKNNNIVKNIILDFLKPNDDVSKIKMIVEQNFLRDSFLFYKKNVIDVTGLEFYDFYLTDRMETKPIIIIFNVLLTEIDYTSVHPDHVSFTDIVNYCKWIKSIMHFSKINICFLKNDEDYVSIPTGEITSRSDFNETPYVDIINEAINKKINNELGICCCVSNNVNN